MDPSIFDNSYGCAPRLPPPALVMYAEDQSTAAYLDMSDCDTVHINPATQPSSLLANGDEHTSRGFFPPGHYLKEKSQRALGTPFEKGVLLRPNVVFTDPSEFLIEASTSRGDDKQYSSKHWKILAAGPIDKWGVCSSLLLTRKDKGDPSEPETKTVHLCITDGGLEYSNSRHRLHGRPWES